MVEGEPLLRIHAFAELVRPTRRPAANLMIGGEPLLRIPAFAKLVRPTRRPAAKAFHTNQRLFAPRRPSNQQQVQLVKLTNI